MPTGSKFSKLVAYGICCLPLIAFGAPPAGPQELQGLLLQVGSLGCGSGCITPEMGQLAAKFQVHGTAAIPSLLALLQDERAHVREFAGYVLRDQPGLTEDHLAALVAALERGSAWLPPAIARIDTPAARRALVDALVRAPETNGQLSFAFNLAGAKASRLLVSVLENPKRIDSALADSLCGIFKEQSNAETVDALLRVALDRAYAIENRGHAIIALGCVGPSARRTIAPLRDLARDDPAHFEAPLELAIRDMKTPETVALLVEALRIEQNPNGILDIARLGTIGKDAGPFLLPFLSHSDRELRLAAALALGRIGYTDAGSALIPLLSDPDDWRLVYAAANSLARLKTHDALPALQRVAATHWYPLVEKEIRKSIEVIKGTRKLDVERAGGYAALYPFDRQADAPMPIRLPRLSKEPAQLTRHQLANLAFEIEPQAGDDAAPNMLISPVTPRSGIKVDGGYLLGVDHGEFGGMLVYSSGSPKVDVLLNLNTRNVHVMPFGTIAMTGMFHMGINDGAIYLVGPDGTGKHAATFWKRLPGAPRQSGLLKNGNLVVDCWGGTVIVTPAGELMMASQTNMR